MQRVKVLFYLIFIGFYFYECSAKSGQNVEEAFQTMLKHLYNKTIENKVKYVY